VSTFKKKQLKGIMDDYNLRIADTCKVCCNRDDKGYCVILDDYIPDVNVCDKFEICSDEELRDRVEYE
jgi:hypothetical protein